MEHNKTKKQTSVKRYDSKKRRLRPNEYQRPNGTYEFRFKDLMGKERSLYRQTLEELRNAELVLEQEIKAGIDYTAGLISVEDMVQQYFKTKGALSINSKRAYGTVLKRISSSTLGKTPIRNVNIYMAKAYCLQLHEEGLSRNTIQLHLNLLHPAFEIAVEENAVYRNPFRFSLHTIISVDKVQRNALSQDQVNQLLEALQTETYSKYIYEVVILLGTGLRISELYGLTMDDVDFDKNCIRVFKQLCRTAEHPYAVLPPKSAQGVRTIHLSDGVREAFQMVLAERPNLEVEPMVDGYCRFVFLDKHNMPKVAMHLQNHLRRVRKQKLPADFPKVSPHVFRHTFCSNMVKANMDVKSLQYLMGHSDAETTLNIYSHTEEGSVAKQFVAALQRLQDIDCLPDNLPEFPVD